MKKNIKTLSFVEAHENMAHILTDHKLASLGDTYINFAYSLALSNRNKVPSGAKVKGTVLAEALRKADLREFLPSRMTRHALADAAEAIIVYAWLHRYITLEETVNTLEKNHAPVEGFSQLLTIIKSKIKFS